jgi:TonB family protein
MTLPRRVSALVLLTCIVTRAFGGFGDADPKRIGDWDPKWPFKINLGEGGTATFSFVVTDTGQVRDVKLVDCSRPDLEEPAVEAILGWGWSPGIRFGKPITMTEVMPITLSVLTAGFGEGTAHYHGRRGWGVAEHAPSGTPPAFDYDTPPEPTLALPAVYPRDLMVARVTGSATIAFTIDPSGMPRQFAVVEASNPEFGPPTIAMMRSWRFTPPLNQGSPCWAAIRMTQKYRLSDEDVETDDDTDRILSELRDSPCPIVADIGELDAKPAPLYFPYLQVPEEMVKGSVPARAVIEIVIYRKGHAQAAKIISATREDFGWVAATAVGRWEFTAPKKDGKPVDVFARLPFEYRPPPVHREEPGAPIEGVSVSDQAVGWKEFGPYLDRMEGKIRDHWQTITERDPEMRAPGGRVTVRLVLTAAGEFERVVWIHHSDSAEGRPSRACLSAIMASAPFERWTPAMVSALGNEQELTLEFAYR